MSKTYTKLDDSITDSTIWMESSDTRVVWITLLAMADWDGYVGASVPGIANRARVSLEAAETAMAKFQAPDPHSRSKFKEGRRVEVAPRGFLIINFAEHRDRQLADARREYFRQKKREQRANVQDKTVDMLDNERMSTHSDRDSDSDGDRDRNGSDTDSSEPVQPASKPPGTPAPGLLFETVGKGPRTFQVTREQLADWAAAYPGVDVATEARKALEWTRANPSNRKTARGMVAFLLRWFGKAQDSAPRSQVRQVAASPYCDWHLKSGTARKRSLSPKAGCPECRNVEAASRQREGKPEPVSFDFIGGT